MTSTSARRAGRVTAAVCAATLSAGLAACAPMTIGATAAIGLSPPGLGTYYEQQLDWGACDSMATTADEQKLYADPALQCARMEVPLDYKAPNGRTAQIAVLRRATGDERRIGSLVLNPGGPGGSGVQLAAGGLGSTLSTAVPFDIVGFDPRGIGKSTPKLDCLTPADEAEIVAFVKDAAPSAAPSVADIEQGNRAMGEQCAVRSGGVDVLANSGTRDVARDLDVLRAVLGDRKLTYLGFSYGTLIGATYAEMFPGKVRAMILDGAVDPNQPTAEEDVAMMAARQEGFEAYAADCAKAVTCPLGTDPAEATAAFQALARPLLESPVPAGAGRQLAFGDAVGAVVSTLYAGPGGWSALTAGLTELRAGTGERLLAIAESGGEPDSEGMMIVNCADNDRFTDRAEVAERDARMRKAIPFADSGTPDGVAALGECDLWPAPASGTTHLPQVNDLPTVLVVSTTIDPATPYEAGVALAEELHARLLTVENVKHTAVFGDLPCADSIATDYLVTLTLPEDGARCSATAEVSK